MGCVYEECLFAQVLLYEHKENSTMQKTEVSHNSLHMETLMVTE